VPTLTVPVEDCIKTVINFCFALSFYITQLDCGVSTLGTFVNLDLISLETLGKKFHAFKDFFFVTDVKYSLLSFGGPQLLIQRHLTFCPLWLLNIQYFAAMLENLEP
jgi:hypothetical protein